MSFIEHLSTLVVIYIPVSLTSRVAEALLLGTMMVGQAVAFAPNYSKARVAASQIFSLLDRRPAIDTSPGVGLRLVSVDDATNLLHRAFSLL